MGNSRVSISIIPIAVSILIASSSTTNYIPIPTGLIYSSLLSLVSYPPLYSTIPSIYLLSYLVFIAFYLKLILLKVEVV